MAITLKVAGGSTITGIPYLNLMNVKSALEKAYDMYVNPPAIPPLSFGIEFFGSYKGEYLGYIVTQMDGTAQQGNMYWMLYVNNVAAILGIDRSILYDGDIIEFKYEAYSESLHCNTILAKVIAIKQALK
jgi:hypothetical protein